MRRRSLRMYSELALRNSKGQASFVLCAMEEETIINLKLVPVKGVGIFNKKWMLLSFVTQYTFHCTF